MANAQGRTHDLAAVYPNYLSQPHAGPLLLYRQRIDIQGLKIRRERPKLVETALSELEHLANLVQHGRRRQFNSDVPAKLRHHVWELLGDQITVTCPHDVEYNDCRELRIFDTGVTLHFERKGGRYRLTNVSSK